MKEKKKQINHGVGKSENEIFKTKEEELDTYIKQIKLNKVEIKKLWSELEQDKNFARMTESENIAKENYRKLQQLLDENMQLKKIHGG